MEILSKFMLPVALFFVTLGFGFWLHRLGTPYNGFLFNLHKLAALAGVVLAVIQFSKTLASLDGLGWVAALLILAGLCGVALFVTGGLLSAGKWDHKLALTIHRISLGVMAVDLGLVTLWLGKYSL